MITKQQMVEKLNNIQPGTLLFVSYLAGREPTPRALQEAHDAIASGINPRHFTGKFDTLRTTKNGDVVLTIFTTERSTMGPRGHENGAYRSFNPNLGQLLTLEIIE